MTPALRVTHVVNTDHRRGAEVAASHLVDALDDLGIAGRLVALWPDTGHGGDLGADAVLVDQLPTLHPRSLVRVVRALRRDLRRHPADIVLAHGAQPALVSGIASLLGGPPFVWQRILQMPAWPLWHPHHAWLRLVAARAAGVVALTDKTADETRRLGFRGPVWQIPNHRPAALFTANGNGNENGNGSSLRDELGIAMQTPLVGFVGHLVAQKDPRAAVEILRRLGDDHPTAELVVAGDGPERAAVVAATEAAGLTSRVHVLGHRTDIPRVLADLQVLVLPSRSESMPGIVVEAQLAGCPVVAYPVDGIEHALAPGRSGVVTSVADPAEAAAAISGLLDDRDRLDAMALAGPDHAAGLTTEGLAHRYAGMLSLLARSEPRGERSVRVVHVLPDLGVGGAERALAVLAQQLHPDDVSQVVATVSGARRPLRETVHGDLQRAGVPLADLGVRRRPTRSLRGLAAAAVRLRRLARTVDADVVDAALLDAALPARIGPRRWRLVTHLVNTPWEPVVLARNGGSRLRTRVLRTVDRWSSRRDDALVALTEPVAEAARRDLHLRTADPRVRVIPRGVDVTRFAPGSPDAATDVRVVAVGRLVPQKGHDVLIRAVAAASRAGAGLRLGIAGEGRLDDELTALVTELGVDGTVQLLGPVSDVAALLRSSSVFALASRWEGQSNAVIEAMACGLAVVVSDVPALREVVADAGRLVPPDDVDAPGVLAELAADPDERARLGAAARARVEERYGAAARAAELADLYREVATRATERPRP